MGMRNKHFKDVEKLKSDSEGEIANLTEKLNQIKEDNEELKTVKKELTDQMRQASEAWNKSIQEIKVEKETQALNHENEIASVNNELKKLQDNILEKEEKIESLIWKKNEMEKQLDKLKGEFDDEMSEMVDVVNDLNPC